MFDKFPAAVSFVIHGIFLYGIIKQLKKRKLDDAVESLLFRFKYLLGYHLVHIFEL